MPAQREAGRRAAGAEGGIDHADAFGGFEADEADPAGLGLVQRDILIAVENVEALDAHGSTPGRGSFVARNGGVGPHDGFFEFRESQ